MGRLLDALAWLWRPPPHFAIRVRGGRAATRGVVTARFVAACETVLRDHGVPDGTIEGVRGDQGVFLRFSRAVPEAARQNVRNAWAVYR